MFYVKNLVASFFIMLKRFTIININFNTDIVDEDHNLELFIIPIIGLLIGLPTFILSLLKFIYSPMFISILLVIYFCIITKLNSLKDLVTTFDYFMEKKNINAELYRAVIIPVLLLFYFCMFYLLPTRVVMIMPFVGFCSIAIYTSFIKRDKDTTSLLKFFTEKHSIFSIACSFAITIIINYRLTIALSLTYFLGILLTYICEKRVKKIPSCIEGIFIEFSQIVFLCLCYLLFLY